MVEIAGKTFGKVIALERKGKNKRGNTLWDCVCECGKYIALTEAQLTKYSKTRDCGCGIGSSLRVERKKELKTVRTVLHSDVLEVEPSMLVITDLLHGRVLLTAIDNAQHVSISVDKQLIDRVLQRFRDEPMLKQWVIDSESYNTIRPHKPQTIWAKVKTLIIIKRETTIIHATVHGDK